MVEHILAESVAVFGCDYNTKEIWLSCISDQARIHSPRSWCIDATDFPQAWDRLHHQMAAIAPDAPVYIEKVWSFNNPKTTMALQRVATFIEVCAVVNGHRVEWAHPGTWRKEIHGKGARLSTKIFKKMAVDYVKEHYGLEVKHDQAESILIALYGWRVKNGNV